MGRKQKDRCSLTIFSHQFIIKTNREGFRRILLPVGVHTKQNTKSSNIQIGIISNNPWVIFKGFTNRFRIPSETDHKELVIIHFRITRR